MSSGEFQGGRQQGFTYLALMFAVAIAGAVLAATGIIWSQTSQREKEAELLFIGNEFRQAIGLYYQRSPGAAKQYPQKIEDLIEDRRYLSAQRYLRRLYSDPMTGRADWGLIPAPDGGVMGIYSLSTRRPIKKAGFAQAEETALFAAATSYTDWTFSYAPANPSAVAPQPSGLPATLPGPALPTPSRHPG